MEDREAIGKIIYYRRNSQSVNPWEAQGKIHRQTFEEDADAIIKYLEGTDGE